MAAITDLVDVAKRTGQKRWPPGSISEVRIEPASGADGSDILRVMFVMNGDIVTMLNGDVLVDTIVDLNFAFQAIGDERSPVVEYLSQTDLDDDGDPES